VGGVERGQRNIALKNICKLACALGLSPSALLVSPVISETSMIIPSDPAFHKNGNEPKHRHKGLPL
jgi:hypothetical protein